MATVTDQPSGTPAATQASAAEANEKVLEDLADALEPFWGKHMRYWAPGKFAAVALVLGIDVKAALAKAVPLS